LSGISPRTLRHWAHTGFYRPSISPAPRDYLWSWTDLLALRAIDWLRRKKVEAQAPRASSHRIREALRELVKDGLPPHKLRDLTVSGDGQLVFCSSDGHELSTDLEHQGTSPRFLKLVAPYEDRGPDLLEPRPLLRIIPGKLHGEPHIVRTRISTAVLYSLAMMDYPSDDILEMYPDVVPAALAQALDLEQQLHRAA
jgi:uncharacterized protein (DUF433 family)